MSENLEKMKITKLSEKYNNEQKHVKVHYMMLITAVRMCRFG